MNMVAFMFMFALGLNSAACTTIGHQIGRGDIARAKEYYHISRHIAFFIIAIAVTCMMTFKHNIIGLFTNIESVKFQCEACIFLAALGTFPDLW